jgi:heme oxygenase
MDASWMLTRLKNETRVHHVAADEDRVALAISAVTPSEYRAFLIKLYGLESPIEAMFAMTKDLRDVFDLRTRTQVRLLKADLRALGVTDPSRLPVCRNVGPFRDIPEALGWMYVTERAAPLRGVIRQHFEQRLPDQMRIAGCYLAGHERGAHARWVELGIALEQIADTTALADRIVATAHMAFRCQHQWLREAASPLVQVA